MEFPDPTVQKDKSCLSISIQNHRVAEKQGLNFSQHVPIYASTKKKKKNSIPQRWLGLKKSLENTPCWIFFLEMEGIKSERLYRIKSLTLFIPSLTKLIFLSIWLYLEVDEHFSEYSSKAFTIASFSNPSKMYFKCSFPTFMPKGIQ